MLDEVDKRRAVVALLYFAREVLGDDENVRLDFLDSAERVASHFGLDLDDLASSVFAIVDNRT